jgi:hypothetical protein
VENSNLGLVWVEILLADQGPMKIKFALPEHWFDVENSELSLDRPQIQLADYRRIGIESPENLICKDSWVR